MNIENDKKLKKLKIRKGISTSRYKIYLIVLKDIYKITKKTPTQLINEAKEEQQPYIENDKIIFHDIEDRKITQYFYEYYEYLINKKLTINTIDSYLKTLRSFYNEYDIVLPKNIQLDKPKILIHEGKIPVIGDVEKGINATNNLRNKALILFMATSGIRTGDTINFKISDLLEATKEYHNGTLSDLLKQKPNNIIPTWYFIPRKTSKKGNICVTFNTPETMEYLFVYLKNRENITEDSFLFEFDEKKLSNFTIIHVFRRINDSVFHRNKEGKRFFHAHSLRKFFISTCNHHSGDLAKVNLLSGHSNKSNVHDTYNEINTNVMKEFYTKLIPYLSIRDTKVHEIKPKEIIKLEKELEEFRKVLSPETLEALKKLNKK